MKTIKKDGFTVYLLNNGDEFRIKQISDSEYIIEESYTKEEKVSIWGKKKQVQYWERIDDDGYVFYSLSGFSNENNFTIHETKESAIKWIEDFEKYPIIH